MNKIPPNITHVEHGWKALKIQGKLDFGLVGIIANISGLLASSNISVFVISTYNTDYILIKEKNIEEAKKVLESHGYVINF